MGYLREKFCNNKMLFITLGVVLSIAVAVGISYAIWILTNTQTSKNIVQTGCFDITFVEDTDGIELRNAYPITDEAGVKLSPYTFTITNTCDIAAGYQVNIEMLNTTTLDHSLLKTVLDTGTPTILNTNSIVVETIADATSYMIYQGILEKDQSVTHNLRMWLDESATLENSQKKLAESKVVIIATPTKVPGAADEIQLCKDEYAMRGYTATSGSEFNYIYGDDGVVIHKYTGTSTDLVIPCEIDNKPVVEVGGDAIVCGGEGCLNKVTISQSIDSVVIPSTVNVIKEYAFYDTWALNELIILDGVEIIGNNIYNNPPASVEIGFDNILHISENIYNSLLANYSSQFSDVLVKNTDANGFEYLSVKDNNTFKQLISYSGSSENITIPDGVTSISGNALNRTWSSVYPSLKNIFIPDSVVFIEDITSGYEGSPFGTNELTVNADGFVYTLNADGTPHTIYDYYGTDKDIVIPEGTLYIDEYAFQYADLTSVVIPASVKTIGHYAFDYNQLTNVVIPNDIVEVSSRAFTNNPFQTTAEGFNCTYNADGSPHTIYGYSGSETDLELPEGTKYLNKFGVYNLNSLYLPDSFISLDNTFYGLPNDVYVAGRSSSGFSIVPPQIADNFTSNTFTYELDSNISKEDWLASLQP